MAVGISPEYVKYFGISKQVDEDQALLIDVECSSKLTASWLNKFMNVYVIYVYILQKVD